MIVALAAALLGLAALAWSADIFVHGGAGLALRLGLTRATVGLTLVAFGTSAPEMMTSGTAALTGSPGLAVGNVLGSNIANTGLVLGVTLVLAPLVVPRDSRRRDLPACLAVTLLAGLLLADGRLTTVDGLALLAALGLVLWLLWRSGNGRLADEIQAEKTATAAAAWARFFGGLLLLLISARVLVWGATRLALELGVSESVVGLTLVALGTSLPELATCIAAVMRGHPSLALGNVLGSNVLNLVTVLPLPALLAPGAVEAALVHRDYAIMLGLTLLMALMLTGLRRPGRVPGLVLLACYGGYIALLGIQSF